MWSHRLLGVGWYICEGGISVRIVTSSVFLILHSRERKTLYTNKVSTRTLLLKSSCKPMTRLVHENALSSRIAAHNILYTNDQSDGSQYCHPTNCH